MEGRFDTGPVERVAAAPPRRASYDAGFARARGRWITAAMKRDGLWRNVQMLTNSDAHFAREEVLRLRDQVVAAERDQQDLKTARARLARIKRRGLVDRVLNR